jgi:hypothetical protein
LFFSIHDESPREQEICVPFFVSAVSTFASAAAAGFIGLTFSFPTTSVSCLRLREFHCLIGRETNLSVCRFIFQSGDDAKGAVAIDTTDCTTAMNRFSTSISSISVHLSQPLAARHAA